MKKILYFTASWCGPCKALAPRMESLAGQINYEKIDVDNNQDLSMKYGVRNVPTLVLIDQSGKEINRLVGNVSEQQVKQFYNG